MDATRPKRRRGIALPRAHFLGLAPLETWARLVWVGGRRVGARYALRVAGALWGSVIGTVVTLPERVVLGPFVWWRFFRRGVVGTLREGPPVVAVLGYYRSGTTHLHYVLSCDRRFVTPRWFQATAPTGWWLSWSLLRWALIPLTPNRRPQDDMTFGPDWPAEDDFALAAWTGASALAWRFVFPSERGRERRWLFLEGERERALFRRTLAAFCWKVTSVAPGKRLLLKSPSHTARVRELVEVFGDRVRFVHIVREPEPVIRSNTRMAERLSRFALEDLPAAQETRDAIAREYEEVERVAREQLADLPAGTWSRVRYQDLIADPVGELERVYGELGLGWTSELEAGVLRYLHAVREYRTEDQKNGTRAPEPEIGEASEEERAACARLREEYHREPTVPARPLPAIVGADPSAGRMRLAWIATPIVAAACLAAWLGVAHASGNRFDTFVWVWGTVIGYAAIRIAGRGTAWLGAWAALWFLVLVGASIYPLPELANGWVGVDRVKAIRTAYGTPNSNYTWIALGALAAWRYASRRHVKPPGR